MQFKKFIFLFYCLFGKVLYYIINFHGPKFLLIQPDIPFIQLISIEYVSIAYAFKSARISWKISKSWLFVSHEIKWTEIIFFLIYILIGYWQTWRDEPFKKSFLVIFCLRLAESAVKSREKLFGSYRSITEQLTLCFSDTSIRNWLLGNVSIGYWKSRRHVCI